MTTYAQPVIMIVESMKKGGRNMDLSEWTFVRTFGTSLDIYANGILRVIIERETGRQVTSYVMNREV